MNSELIMSSGAASVGRGVIKRLFRPAGFAVLLLLSFSGYLAGWSGSADSLPITVKAELDKDTITIGEEIKYTLRVTTRKNIEVEFPNFTENLADFTIKDFGCLESGFWGKKKLRQWYLLDTYLTGKYTIPQALIKYRQKGQNTWCQIQGNEVEVEVKSLLPEADAVSDIRDIKGPRAFPRRVNYYLILAILTFTSLVVLAAIIWLKKRKSKPAAIKPQPAADQLARQAFEQLNRKDYLRSGKIKQYYAELSLIVRKYIENRFNLRAPEMTTEEFLLKVRGSGEISLEHKSLLGDFLAHCDLVKFARYGPSEKEIELSFSSAKRFVEQTKAITNSQPLALT